MTSHILATLDDNRAMAAIYRIRALTLLSYNPIDYDPAAYTAAHNAIKGVQAEFAQWHAFVTYMHASSAVEERRELCQWIREVDNYGCSLDAIYVDSKPSGMVYAHFVLACGRGTRGVLLALEVDEPQRNALRAYIETLTEDLISIRAAQFYSGDDPGDSNKSLAGFQVLACRLCWFAFCDARLA